MITWLVQTEDDLPALPPAAWLSPPERERLARLQVEKRRREWLLGRWTAKRLLQAHLGEPVAGPALDALAIVAAPDGAPELVAELPSTGPVRGPLRLAISHSHGRAFCAVAERIAIGADIELVTPRHPTFAHDYFTAAELASLAAAPAAAYDTLVTAIWSAKESTLKALRLGLTVDTRQVDCQLAPASATEAWATVRIHCDPVLEAPPLCGWWRVSDGYVLTLAAAVA